LPRIGVLYKKERLKTFRRSFSNRVYISFIAISLIPLLLVAFSTRSFFERIFSQQFTEKAEIQADFAIRVMDDFILTQQEEQRSLTLPPDNVVYWISSIIFNDVNLYQDGVIVSSNRQEFFDYGFFPELIDGEIFYKIQYENNPFYTQTQKIGDYSFHTLTIPYFLQNSLLLISLPFPLEQQEIAKASAEMIEFFLFLSFFFIVVVFILARGVGGMIVNPIKRLLAGTREVSLGNLEVSIPHKHQDEMKTLIDGFNTMVKNLKKHQQDLTEMSKKAASAEMARKVAHEIKNPLTPIQLSAEHLLTVYEDESTTEVENLRKIAHEFLAISKEAHLQMKAIDLKNIVQETIKPYKNILSKRIPINESYKGDDFDFMGDKEKIKIAIRNIFTNAIEAIRDHGEINVDVIRSEKELDLIVEDTGTGMSQTVLKRIFEPYFSTKDMGTGLGLSIAKKIIEDHGGTIQAVSEEKKGTQILIKLPAHQDSEKH
jgi:signal transduction histidine kinase